MDVKCLPEEVRNILRSGMHINSVKQCVLELVYNSLDAKSTAIAVRLDLSKFYIQVVDNGDGISRENMSQIGLRYMTNKCQSIRDLKRKQSFYGFRGEAISSIRSMSQKVIISSRSRDCEETYSIIFDEIGVEIQPARFRPSCGTTVTIENFMYNMPVRQNRINVDIDMEDLREELEALAIIHAKVSFSLRNNINKKMLFNNHSTRSVAEALVALHSEIDLEDIVQFKVSNDKISFNCLFTKKTLENKNLQLIYVNKRKIYAKDIKKHLVKMLGRSYLFNRRVLRENQEYPVYIINISCSYTRVDLNVASTKTVAVFRNPDEILRCLEKAVEGFLQDQTILSKTNVTDVKSSKNSRSSYSLMSGAFKSGVIKKRKVQNSSVPMKSLDIVESSQKSTVQTKSNKKYRREHNHDETKVEKSIRSYFCEGSQRKRLSIEESGAKNRKISKMKNDNDQVKKQVFKKKNKVSRNDNRLQRMFMQNYKSAFNSSKNKNKDTPEFRIDREVSEAKSSNIGDVMFQKPFEKVPKERQNIFDEHSDVGEQNGEEISSFRQVVGTEEQVGNGPVEEKKGKSLIMDMFLKSTQLYKKTDETTNLQESPESANFTFMKKQSDCNSAIMYSVNYQKKTRNALFTLNQTLISVRKKKRNVEPMEINIGDQFPKKKSQIIQTSLSNKIDAEKISRAVQTEPNLENEDSKESVDLNDASKFVLPSATNNEIDDTQNYNIMRYFQEFSSNKSSFPKEKQFSIKKFYCNNLYLQTGHGGQISFTTGNDSEPPKTIVNNPKTKKDTNNVNLGNPDENYKGNCLYESPSDYLTYNSHYYNRIPKSEDKIGKFRKYHSTDVHNNFKINFAEKDNEPEYGNFGRQLERKTSFYMPNNIRSTPFEHIFTIPTGNMNETLVLSHTDVTDDKIFDSLYEPWKENVEERVATPVNNLEVENDNKGKSEDLFANTPLDFSFLTPNLKPGVQLDKMEQTENIILDSCRVVNNSDGGNGWVESADQFGKRFFINQRTGMTSFITPEDKLDFGFKRRAEFLPKGYSPAFTRIKPLDISLSPNSKVNLHKKLFEQIKDELDTIKWENYFTNEDPKSFFDKIYDLKNQQIEQIIPNACDDKFKLDHFENGSTFPKFNRDMFENIEIIGQLDKKFIVTILRAENVLILFDQHAVHERIRLEQLYEDYFTEEKLKRTSLKRGMLIRLNDKKFRIIENCKPNLVAAGLEIKIKGGNVIEITAIPTCYFNKFKNESSKDDLQAWVLALINEKVEMIKNCRGNINQLPNAVKNVINLEACRGAIKFGEKLTNQDCQKYIKLLARCKLPFQCAHGRPTLAPVIMIQKCPKKDRKAESKVNINKLFKKSE